MRSVKNAALGTVVLLFVLIVTTVKGYAAPAETSHWNSNTFGNLNTLADKTTVTFSITYNETGTIEWFKDGVLADTLSGATSAQFTTAWSETGMKEVKARMTNGGGTAETVWPVEVQETGDGLVEEYITYPQNRVNGHLTINVTNGWVNFQTLYLKTKDPENWLEYVSSGTYLMKANIRIAANGVLKADDGSARVLRIRALPLQNHFFGELDADFGGTVNIDSMTIVGWNVDLSTEIAITDQSAWIGVGENSTLKLKNSTLRWVQVRSLGGTTAHTEIDNNRFHGGNTFNLYMGDLANQTVSNNSFIYSGGGLSLVGCGGMNNTFIHNVFRGLPGGTLTVGSYCKVIDNDFSYSDWNQVEANNNVLLRDNLFHDNGGQHNGINQMWHNVYSINDTFRDFSNFSGCYSQVSVTGAQPEPWSQFADHVYIINAHAANVPRAFFFAGSHDVYIYNLLSEQSGGQIEFGTYNFFIRKSEFVTVKDTSSDFALCVPDWDPGAYRYVQNVTILDTVFSGVNKGDIAFFPAGSGIINAINCLRKNGDGSIKDPDSFISNVQLETGAKPEVRHYAWLDVLVKDQSGHLIPRIVSLRSFHDPDLPLLHAL